MPNTGVLMPNSVGSHFGAPLSATLFGPPDKMIPIGLRLAIVDAGVSGGHTSEYTFNSRRRRAINCVYCDPKSKTMMVWWLTAGESYYKLS